jgi:hypothetical protein
MHNFSMVGTGLDMAGARGILRYILPPCSKQASARGVDYRTTLLVQDKLGRS